MKHTKEALTWIISILQKYQVPFQITGGLAAHAYGAERELADIDIDIPEDKFELIIQEVEDYIIDGPHYFKDNNWNMYLLTLCYKNQDIDLSGAHHGSIYDQKNKIWTKLITDFSMVEYKEIMRLTLPVIARKELISYKKILARPVDLLDIQKIQNG